KMATACLKFLRDHMWDKQRGGYYFMVSREGKVIDSTKQLNPMSYVMEGLAGYALAFHDPQAAGEALNLFEVIDEHAHDNKYGGYDCNADWSLADRNGDSKQSEYGLVLESSWLIVEPAQRVGLPQDAKSRRASPALVDHALRYGFDNEKGVVYRYAHATGTAV